jgi:biopolymer transport protein ExbD
MYWTIRHQGSPRALDNLSKEQVIAGLRDGAWDGTDEVRQAGEVDWQPIEAHPQFADAAAEVQEPNPPLVPVDAEEQRIDMNPLIDVCLVLLVFSILATTYQLIDRVLDLPTNQATASRDIPTMTLDAVRERMILVRVRQGAEGPVFHIGDEPIGRGNLEIALKRAVRETRRQEVVIDAREVEWGSVVRVIDAASGAKVRKVHFKLDPEKRIPVEPDM